jgi:hypothetical protein
MRYPMLWSTPCELIVSVTWRTEIDKAWPGRGNFVSLLPAFRVDEAVPARRRSRSKVSIVGTLLPNTLPGESRTTGRREASQIDRYPYAL